MSCAIDPISLAHQWRKSLCDDDDGALRKNHCRLWFLQWVFPIGAPTAQWRKKQEDVL
jgi:hypothetical protein